MAPSKRIAVILSGSGVYDGSEVHEASAAMVALSRGKADYSIFAPDIPQMHTINHLNGQEESVNRNVLQESARIARGNISALTNLNVKDFDGLIFPGGFGAAKNLSNVAVKGPDCEVNQEVRDVISNFHVAKKPMGFCCIAPTIVAKVLGSGEVTVGRSNNEDGKWPYADTAQAIEKMGVKHVETDVNISFLKPITYILLFDFIFQVKLHFHCNVFLLLLGRNISSYCYPACSLTFSYEVHIDENNRIVTTAAFMCDTAIHKVHDGVAAMVRAVLDMA